MSTDPQVESQKVVFGASNTRNKTGHTMSKDIESCVGKWWLFIVYHFVSGHLGVLKDVNNNN